MNNTDTFVLQTPSPSPSPPPSSLKRTVVTVKRKEELLLRARVERKRWIRAVTFPYDSKKLMKIINGGNSNNNENTTITTSVLLSTSRRGHDGGLDKLQDSLICSNRYLSNATSILSELYGITVGDDDDDDDNDNDYGDDDKNLLRKYPLSIDEVADRVERLAKPHWLKQQQKQGNHQQKNNTNVTGTDKLFIDNNDDISHGMNNQKPSVEKNDKESSSNDDGFNKYEDLSKIYKEFTDTMLLPESAITVQGMKNFVRQFANAVTRKDNDDIDSKDNTEALLRNMASALNNHVRSSYESLAGTRDNRVGSDTVSNNKTSSSSSSSIAQGEGQPDWDRRSLESFLYGQVKGVLDPALDQITCSTSNSPFPMTQKQLNERLEELQFLQPSHLEIACLNDDDNNNDGGRLSPSKMSLEILLEEPIGALRSIEAFYSPYEKLQRVLDIFRGVNAALTKISKMVPSADDVLPTMILVVVKAAAVARKTKTTKTCRNSNKTSSLQSLLRDLYFVENFALPEYLRGEAGYAFTNLYGAVQFLQDLDLDGTEGYGKDRSNVNRLSIGSDELRRGLEKSRAVAARNNAKRNSINITGSSNSNGSQWQSKGLISRGIEDLLGERSSGDESGGVRNDATFVPSPPKLSVREVRAARLRGETLDLAWALRRQDQELTEQEHSRGNESLLLSSSSKPKLLPQRYTFLGVRPENVKLSDLPKLLDEYRRLVLSTEELLGEQQRANNRIQSERKRIRDENHRRGLGERALLL